MQKIADLLGPKSKGNVRYYLRRAGAHKAPLPGCGRCRAGSARVLRLADRPVRADVAREPLAHDEDDGCAEPLVVDVGDAVQPKVLNQGAPIVGSKRNTQGLFLARHSEER